MWGSRVNVSAVREAALGNKSLRGGYSEQAQNRQACVEGEACVRPRTPWRNFVAPDFPDPGTVEAGRGR